MEKKFELTTDYKKIRKPEDINNFFKQCHSCIVDDKIFDDYDMLDSIIVQWEDLGKIKDSNGSDYIIEKIDKDKVYIKYTLYNRYREDHDETYPLWNHLYVNCIGYVVIKSRKKYYFITDIKYDLDK